MWNILHFYKLILFSYLFGFSPFFNKYFTSCNLRWAPVFAKMLSFSYFASQRWSPSFSVCSLKLLCFYLTAFSTFSGEPMKIRPKQCSNAIGEEGTCMFVWECIKTEGKHLGTCADGFLFGSCCGHNDTFNSVDHHDQGTEFQTVPSVEVASSTIRTTTMMINKDKHKNKWKPQTTTTTTTTTTKAPVITQTTSHTTTSTKRPNIYRPHPQNGSNSVWSSSFGSPFYKPGVTSQRPWYIYPGTA